MKKLYILLFAAAILVFSAIEVQAQAKKYPLFEHFTQASCGPCATLNPFFQAVYENNVTNTHHVAYHTYWPGTDPMYDYNPSDIDPIISYYSVSGVPTMVMDGDVIGSPSAVSQGLIDDAAAPGSPIRIIVTESTVGSTRNVNVEVQTVGTVPAGSYRLKAAVVERLIEYGSPPGSNGETEFPNVFRQVLTATTAGDVITLAAIGESVSFDYSYDLDDVWVEDEIYVLAWVQQTVTKEILNSGATGDPKLEYVNTSENIFTNAGGTFNSSVMNVGDAGESFTISFVANQPADWTASYSYAGNTYTGDHTATLSGGGVEEITLSVSTGTSVGVGEYIITISSDDPNVNPMVARYYTISGVTDLIVNNVEPWGDGSAYETYDFEPLYVSGLEHAGNTTFGVCGDNVFAAGMKGDALADVKNIYFNVAWTFPALTKDELRNYIKDFLDAGGNLFISGQDIGWEVDYFRDNGLPAANTFFENYLHAEFVNDAAAGASTFTAVTDDSWFGTVATSDISKPYGTTYYYPEQVDVIDADGFAIFTYNDSPTKIGGVRSETDTYKTVYLGIGIEMIEDDAIRDEVVKLSHDYFYGSLNGIDFDNAMQALLGNMAPNPASYTTQLQLSNMVTSGMLVITDMSGRIVKQLPVAAGTENMTIDISDMESGAYLYQINDGVQYSTVKKFNVVK